MTVKINLSKKQEVILIGIGLSVMINKMGYSPINNSFKKPIKKPKRKPFYTKKSKKPMSLKQRRAIGNRMRAMWAAKRKAS